MRCGCGCKALVNCTSVVEIVDERRGCCVGVGDIGSVGADLGVQIWASQGVLLARIGSTITKDRLSVVKTRDGSHGSSCDGSRTGGSTSCSR